MTVEVRGGKMDKKFRAVFWEKLEELKIDWNGKSVIDIGGIGGPLSLLRSPELKGANLSCLNLSEQPRNRDFTFIKGNANEMKMILDDTYDLVFCNAMLEHDKFFWKSVAEMKRILKPGGLLMIGVPGYTKDENPPLNFLQNVTFTFRFHMKKDYYRFSPQAIEEVFFEGFNQIEVISVLRPPRILGMGFKPLEEKN